MSDRDYLYGHVCAHGSLALSCEMCDLEDFLDEVQEAWTRAEAENARLRVERTAMLDVIEAAGHVERFFPSNPVQVVQIDPMVCAVLQLKLRRVYDLIGDDDE